jgi:transcriptional regulatory protein RtcR
MDSARPLVAIGILGTTLDGGAGPRRWERWRPTVHLVQQDDLLVKRLVLLHGRSHTTLAELVARDVRQVSPETQVDLHLVPMEAPWDFEDVWDTLYAFAHAFPFHPDDEDYVVHITTGTHVAQICLYLLCEARILPARLIQTSPRGRGGEPAWSIVDLDLARYDRIAQRFLERRKEATGLLRGGIETRNPAFGALIDKLELVVLATREPILLEGPTGAGKTALARRIYELRRARRQVQGPLVEVNCATLRGDQAMSALFGHKKGAFTGAAVDRRGLLAEADGGVLFLDEIGELGLDEQAMLLLALEERRFRPVGAEREQRSEFQLLAGTNRDLHDAVRAGRFREDLLARIDLWTFRLPALAERREDIEPNLDWELDRFEAATGRRVRLNREGRERFLELAAGWPWHGNFRELHAIVHRMATLAPGGRVGPREVEEQWTRGGTGRGFANPGREAPDRVEAALGERAADLDRFDRVQLDDVLAVCEASPTLAQAGRTLFAQSRTRRGSVNDGDRLRKYLARFGLSWEGLRVRVGGATG